MFVKRGEAFYNTKQYLCCTRLKQYKTILIQKPSKRSVVFWPGKCRRRVRTVVGVKVVSRYGVSPHTSDMLVFLQQKQVNNDTGTLMSVIKMVHKYE